MKALFRYLGRCMFVLLGSLSVISCDNSRSTQDHIEHTDNNGYSYTTYPNDPTGLRLYKLKNGLSVYLAKNNDEPKIQTYIAVRAGSVYDPADNTGLAHYLEHMLFKGTSKYGTSDWNKEKPVLDEISDLFEKHKAAQTPKEKKAIYKKIDSLSLKASNISIANEYDKMMSSMGTSGVNAHTWNEETVYQSKIPANELDKWIKVERERFGELVLRLFHTELEAVYEEFNRGQDSGYRRLYENTLRVLFPHHPYGQQPTIGLPKHLKNPSMVAIHKYFDKYYVPNNMAVVLVGELDFDSTIKKIDAAFGTLQKKEVSFPEKPKEGPITAPIKVEVKGPESEYMWLTYRAGSGIGSEDQVYLKMIAEILSNGEAGLIDLNLNQEQKVLSAYAATQFQNDYGYIKLSAHPKKGQTLGEAKELLLSQIEKLKKGEFEAWLPEAIINHYKLSLMKEFENATSVASDYYYAFVHFRSWSDELAMIDRMKALTKKDIVTFANTFFGNNYVESYKLQGKAEGLVKVEKTHITPVELNRDKQSAFVKEVESMEVSDIKPVFLNFEEAVKTQKTPTGINVSYVKNTTNDLSTLDIILDMGGDHIKKLPLALDYLNYLGTDKYPAGDLKKEFYKIGIDYSISTSSRRSYVSLSGLDENLEQGLELLNHLMSNVVVDEEAYGKLINTIAQSRKVTLSNKGSILFDGLLNYALHNEHSRLRDVFTIDQLKAIHPQDLVDLIKSLREYPQKAFYYGKDPDKAVKILGEKYSVPKTFKAVPKKREYPYVETEGHVYFSEYDMVQSQFLLLALGDKMDIEKKPYARLLNTYFGSGLSSIIFQEMRESQSLAYTAESSYLSASRPEKRDIVYGFVGTQANKTQQAISSLKKLMKGELPKDLDQFAFAKQAVLKEIAAQRITKISILWTYQRMKDMGIDYDIQKKIYQKVQGMAFDDLKNFFQDNVANKQYAVLIIGNSKDIKPSMLEKYGKFEKMDPYYLFNFKKQTP